MKIAGSNVIITGGGHRLGKAIALSLADAGADLAISYHRSSAAAEETRSEIERRGRRCIAVRADAADPDDVASLLERSENDLGKIDVWIANAGLFRPTPLAQLTDRDWSEMLRANFLTFATVAEQIAPRMRPGGGCIVAIADVAALRPWADHLPYSIAKSCLLAHLRHLAAELAPQVRVNAIAPGPVLFPDGFAEADRRRETSRTLLKREGKPANIACAVIDLIENDYVTGVLLPVDGGRMLS